MRAGRVGLWGAASTLLWLCVGAAAAAETSAARPAAPAATPAVRGDRLSLPAPLSHAGVLAKPADPSALQCDSSEVLTCFESELSTLLNPGCFQLGPGQGGDCASSDTHYMAQYFDPVAYLGDFQDTWRVCEVAWITNDGDTVWPSVGVVRIPYEAVRFPNTMELESLPVQNIASPGDTAEVVVDMRAANIEFTRDHVLYMVLQFPEGGVLTAPVSGPGVLADEQAPDPNCDFFTQDSGSNWYRPDPDTDPLDWGFALVIEPVVAIEQSTWSMMKQLYREGPVRLPR